MKKPYCSQGYNEDSGPSEAWTSLSGHTWEPVPERRRMSVWRPFWPADFLLSHEIYPLHRRLLTCTQQWGRFRQRPHKWPSPSIKKTPIFILVPLLKNRAVCRYIKRSPIYILKVPSRVTTLMSVQQSTFKGDFYKCFEGNKVEGQGLSTLDINRQITRNHWSLLQVRQLNSYLHRWLLFICKVNRHLPLHAPV